MRVRPSPEALTIFYFLMIPQFKHVVGAVLVGVGVALAGTLVEAQWTPHTPLYNVYNIGRIGDCGFYGAIVHDSASNFNRTIVFSVSSNNHSCGVTVVDGTLNAGPRRPE